MKRNSHYSRQSLNYTFFALLSCLVVLAVSCEKKQAASSNKSAHDALGTFELEPGFKIELVASEPLIADPVDMEIDEYGRLYVVEMHGYPLDKSGTGKIKLLTDTNGDGVMDKSTVYADSLILPNSIMRWKKGVLVTDAPNVLYFEDKDGDGHAEIRDTVLTGFALSNPQHNLNSPVLGMDNWIYLGHEGAVSTQAYNDEFGDVGDEIYYPRKPSKPRLEKNANGRSVRFRPDQCELETTSSKTQFGHSFDAWGHHFLVSNANHIIQEAIAAPYLKRNPDLLISDATQSLSDHGDAAEVFPITQNPEHQLLTDVGVITSACGITAYLGGAFPAPYDGNITFVAEPVSNLVHVDQLKDKGTTFTASRLSPHREFLASKDSKFRPVNMYIGPDGALYIVDYYRQIIEHPEWMGEEVVKSGELYNDTDKGRIYRISAEDSKPAEWSTGLQLGDATDDQLVEQLASSNIWWRQNAQRLLVDRVNNQAVPALVKMATNTASPFGRLHALWTLEGLHELTPELIRQALKDPVAGVRENAIKLAELHLSSVPELTTDLLAMQGDAEPKVRFQLLCTLGFVNTPQAAEVRHSLLFKDVSDNWVQLAALSASSAETASLLKVVLEKFQGDVPAYSLLLQRLTAMVGIHGDLGMMRQLILKATNIESGAQSDKNAALLKGLAQGIKAENLPQTAFQKEEQLLVTACFEHPSGQVRKAAYEMLKAIGLKSETLAKRTIDKAVSIAGDQKQPEDRRAEAIDLISLRNPAPHALFLEKLVAPKEPLSIQLAALRTLSAVPGTAASEFILTQWSVLTPEIRDAAMSTFLVNPERVAILLKAIEDGTIQASSVAWPRKVRLMAQRDEKLRNWARSLFTKNDTEKINKVYQAALELKGNEVKGMEVYQQNCSLCHQIRGTMGVNLGPDLGTTHNWSANAIMANILAPNLSIASGFDLWEVELKNGESVQGIISTEAPNAITLRNAGSMERTISRNDINSLKALNMSVMPDGLDKQINQQQMADLLAFLRQNK
ncbi:MAG: PVC-type heme-binding CxxCH protein [Cyclobacteriaceae bacterium]